LLVIDGATGFIGGAGVAAWWDNGGRGAAPWRDTMVCVHGPLASALQSSFAENWLESTGELLTTQHDFPFCRAAVEQTTQAAHGLVITSAPSAGKATRARMLFQLLLASARRSIRIASPYFLPDRSVLRELAAAVQRGVMVQIIVPGVLNNHPIARRASRRRYGALLRAGVQLHEYQPAMMHAKVMVVDHVWCVVGSTNFDNRSFGLNDEVNLAVQDPALAQRLDRAFESDLARCETVTEAAWRRRSAWERMLAGAGALLERHQ
jgi:cardiolipin synthase